MTDERFSGVVESWREAGFGFIRRDNDKGPHLYVHASDVASGGEFVTLVPGDQVEFSVISTSRGLRCTRVEIVAEAAEICATATLGPSPGPG